jgi:ankyrin repeat protein
MVLLAFLAAVATGQGRRHQLYRLAEAGNGPEVARVLPFVRGLDRPVGKERRTILHGAVKSGSAGVISLLLEAGADPNVTMERGWTPLHLAVETSADEVAAVLLAAGADVALAGELGTRALHLAAERGNVGLVRALMNQGADPLARTQLGWTALHLAVAQGQDEVVELLARRAELVDGTTNQGWTPLHLAAAFDRAQAARVLLAAGARTDARNQAGRTPGLVALRFDSGEAQALLPALPADQPRFEADPKPVRGPRGRARLMLWLTMGYPGSTIPPHGLRVTYWKDGVALVAPGGTGARPTGGAPHGRLLRGLRTGSARDRPAATARDPRHVHARGIVVLGPRRILGPLAELVSLRVGRGPRPHLGATGPTGTGPGLGLDPADPGGVASLRRGAPGSDAGSVPQGRPQSPVQVVEPAGSVVGRTLEQGIRFLGRGALHLQARLGPGQALTQLLQGLEVADEPDP